MLRLISAAGNVVLCHETIAAPFEPTGSGETGVQNCCCEVQVKACRFRPL
jgi:hypothetical protein